MNDVLHVDLHDEEQLEEIRLTAALMVAAAEAQTLSQDSVDQILASSEPPPARA